MAKQNINVGTAANDKKGDSLRAAFVKVNANFTELYTALGINADGNLNIGAFEFAGSVMSTTDSSAIVIDQATTITSNLSVGGDLLPQTAHGGDLGSSTLPWRSLYVSNNTIYIGGTAVGVDANGQLTVSGSQVNAPSSTLVNGAYTVSLDANGNITFPQGTLLGYSDPGGFIINGAVDKDIAIYTYNGADAHGWTFGTDGSLTLPGDIRSEGNINIEINLADSTLRRWQFGEDGSLTLPGGSTIAEVGPFGVLQITPRGGANAYQALMIYPWATAEGDQIHLASGDPTTVDLYLGDPDQYVKIEKNGGDVVIGTNTNTKQWTFGTDGGLTFPDSTVQSTAWTGFSVAADDSTQRSISSGELVKFIGAGGVTTASDAEGNITITGSGGSVSSLVNSTKTLSLGNDGSLTSNGALTLKTPNGIPTSVSNWQGQGGWNQNTYTNLATTGGTGTGLTVDVAANGAGYILIGAITINTPGTGYTAGDVITIDNENSLPGTFTIGVAGTRSWTFGTSGSLTLPIGVSIDSSVSDLYPKIIADSGKLFSVQGQGSTGSAALAWTVDPDAASQYAAVAVTRAGGDNLAKVVLQAQSNSGDGATVKLWKFDETGALTIPGDIRSEGAINIDVNLTDSTLRRWRFGEDGDLVFPDGTTQTTAFAGNAATVDITNTNGIDTNYSITFVENRDGAEILRADVDLTFNSWSNTLTAGNVTTGILKINDGVHEQFQAKVDATGVVTHDCSSGHIFRHTSPDANWTANFTNLNLDSTYATSVTLIIAQGATGYYPSAVQIGGAAQTINWQGNVNPTVSTSRTDVVTFSIINNSGTYTVLGQLTGF